MRVTRLAIGLALGVVLVDGHVALAQAGGGTTRFGMVGIGEGQTLRLNVVAFPPVPCDATLQFLDRNGQPQPIPDKTVSLQPGQGASLSLRWAALNLPAVQRGEVQPVVSIAAGSACAATVEIFSTATGATQVTLPQPTPDLPGVTPQLGLVGLALGQTVRLNVVAYPPDPCSGVLRFLDSHGVPIPEPDMPVALQAGQSAFLDLPAALLGLSPGQRAEVQPVVMLTDGTSACQATVEVFSTASGKTRAVLLPQPIPD
jgi:hypothetical protein